MPTAPHSMRQTANPPNTAKGWQITVRMVAVVVGLCVFTLLVTGLDVRYRVVDSEFAVGANFDRDVSRWRRSKQGVNISQAEAPEVVLQGLGGERASYVTHGIPSFMEQSLVRVCAESKSSQLLTGAGNKYGGQVRLNSYDRGGRRLWYWPAQVSATTGSQDWRWRCLVVPVHEDTASMRLELFASALSGHFFVRNLSLDGVEERWVFKCLRYVACVAWACVWLWVALRLASSKPFGWLKLLAVSLASLFMLVGLVPQPHLNESLKALWFGAQDVWHLVQDEKFDVATTLDVDSDEVAHTTDVEDTRDTGLTRVSEGAVGPPGASQLIRCEEGAVHDESTDATKASAMSPAATGVPSRVAVEASVKRQYWKPEIENLDKWEHLAMFFILAVLASLAYRQHLALKIFFTLVLLSICEQVLQSLSITRDADVADFSFDLLGVTLGSLFAFGGRRIALIRWPLTSGRVDSS